MQDDDKIKQALRRNACSAGISAAAVMNRRTTAERKTEMQKQWNSETRRKKQPGQILPTGIARQLQRLAVERRPEACLGCGFENGCSLHGCAVLRRVSRVVAVAEGGETPCEEDVH